LEANDEAGVLKLRIPVAESAKPRKVQISGDTDKQMIETQIAPAST
jgi:HSP20 family protein